MHDVSYIDALDWEPDFRRVRSQEGDTRLIVGCRLHTTKSKRDRKDEQTENTYMCRFNPQIALELLNSNVVESARHLVVFSTLNIAACKGLCGLP